MNKNTLEQMKRKDSMVKRHISMQDSDISKLKQKLSEQEKLIKNLRDEIQVNQKRVNASFLIFCSKKHNQSLLFQVIRTSYQNRLDLLCHFRRKSRNLIVKSKFFQTIMNRKSVNFKDCFVLNKKKRIKSSHLIPNSSKTLKLLKKNSVIQNLKT